jgi:magnesium transporter
MKHSLTALDHLVTNIPVVHEGDNVHAIVEMFQSKSFDCAEYLFVIDSKERLIDKIETVDLFKMSKNEKIAHHHNRDLRAECISLDLAQGRITNFAIKHDLSVLPVVDNEQRLLGAIPSRAIIHILRKEHIQDMHQLAGINKQIGQVRLSIEEAPIIRVKDRLPWLLLGLAGSMVATILMSKFEAILESHIALAFFIPGIVYLADAIGTQTETIAVRGISLSNISLRKVLFAELTTGLVIGLIMGLIFFPFVWLVYHDVFLAATVSISILFAGGIASTVGLFFPWILHFMKVDPAYGSGPMATIIQDILSILIYLVIAQLIIL